MRKSAFGDAALFVVANALFLYSMGKVNMGAGTGALVAFVVIPAMIAGLSIWRFGRTDAAVSRVAKVGVAFFAIGVLFLVAAVIYSGMYHPEEVLCGTERCSWNPQGTSMGLFVFGNLVLLATIVEFLFALAFTACVVNCRHRETPGEMRERLMNTGT